MGRKENGGDGVGGDGAGKDGRGWGAGGGEWRAALGSSLACRVKGRRAHYDTPPGSGILLGE